MCVGYLTATRTTSSTALDVALPRYVGEGLRDCGCYLFDQCDIEKLLQFICDTTSSRYLYLLVLTSWYMSLCMRLASLINSYTLSLFLIGRKNR